LRSLDEDFAVEAHARRSSPLVDRFVAVDPDHVPPTSIVRDFIGGSGFGYRASAHTRVHLLTSTNPRLSSRASVVECALAWPV
jgi:hypothetical protein